MHFLFFQKQQRFLALIAILGSFLSSCELTKKKKRNPPAPAPKIIVSRDQPITAARDASLQNLIFSFQATEPFTCKAEIWNKNPDQAPFKDNPLKLDCIQSEKKGPGDVQIQLGPVDSSLRYQVIIFLSGESGKMDQITLVENDDGPTVLPPASPGASTTFLVRTSLATSQSLITAFRGESQKTFAAPGYSGCRVSPFPKTNQAGKSKSPLITLVKSSGFATGDGESVVGSNSSLALNYTKRLQYATDWVWTYSLEGKEETFEVEPPAHISLFKVSQGRDLFIGKPQLRGDQILALPFRKTTPLTVTWKSENTTPSSRIEIWFGSNLLNQGIVCHQPASQNSLLIPNQLLLQLPTGLHQILIFLYSEASFESKTMANTTWKFKTADWRFGTLSLQ